MPDPPGRRDDVGQMNVFGKGAKTRTVLLEADVWRDPVSLRGEAGLEAPVLSIAAQWAVMWSRSILALVLPVGLIVLTLIEPLVADAATQVVILDPGQLKSTMTTTGTCGGRSLVSGRSNAWRCNIATSLPNGANLLDPCFGSADDAPDVLCPTNYPQSLDAVEVTLTETLGCIDANPNSCTPAPLYSPNQPNVAFVQLDRGVMCGLVTGATFVVGFERANFGCSDQTWIAGQPFELADGTWDVVRATVKTGGEPIVATSLTLTPVVKAWEE